MADTAAPLVTVVIPCFNQARFLGDAIRSIRQQSWRNVQTVVVNDGSTDDTHDVARLLDVEVLDQENRGLSEARNRGLAAARGEFIVFLDADDELLEDALSAGMEALRRRPDLWCIAGRCAVVDAEGRPQAAAEPVVDTSDLYREWLSRNFVWAPAAALFRRSAVAAVGGFPPELGPAADYAVYLAMARDGHVQYDRRTVARYRQHDGSMSRDPVLMLRATLAVLRREVRLAPAHHRRAVHEGMRAWCHWYGEQIVDRLRADWRDGGSGARQLDAVGVLLRHCPGTVLRHGRRKLRRLLRSRSAAGAPDRRGASS